MGFKDYVMEKKRAFDEAKARRETKRKLNDATKAAQKARKAEADEKYYKFMKAKQEQINKAAKARQAYESSKPKPMPSTSMGLLGGGASNLMGDSSFFGKSSSGDMFAGMPFSSAPSKSKPKKKAKRKSKRKKSGKGKYITIRVN